MKQYKKPLMKIVELEKVDVLTASCADPTCSSTDIFENGFCLTHQPKEETTVE